MIHISADGFIMSLVPVVNKVNLKLIHNKTGG